MPPTILVVDDEADARELLRFFLAKEGFGVAVAADGGEGLSRAKAIRPDLVVTDLNMPHVDGATLIRRLRAEPELARTPIIAVTAYGRGFMRLAEGAGADAACEKPFEFDKLVARVRELLGPPS